MGVGRIVSRGGHWGIFPKFFQGGDKSGEICFFSHSKLRKQPFLLKISKILPLPSDALDCINEKMRFRTFCRKATTSRKHFRWAFTNWNCCFYRDATVFEHYKCYISKQCRSRKRKFLFRIESCRWRRFLIFDRKSEERTWTKNMLLICIFQV